MDKEETIENKEENMQECETETEDKEVKKEETSPETELAELKDRYLRLYAEFENYKKRVQKDKEELIKYGNESLLYEILSVIDNLEMALSHSANSISDGLVKGVEITRREFQRITEKFGLTQIPALGQPFDPSVHHAMSQVESSDVEDNTVVEEYRKGYMFREKVIRPSLVAVSKRTTFAIQPEIKINIESREE